MTATWAAPGRINLIGEHVDYNDGLVLPFALPMATTASVTRNTSGMVTVSSATADETATFPVGVQPGDVTGWAAYAAGVVWAVHEQIEQRGEVEPDAANGIGGLDVAIRSDVPVGAGLSSSAALECSVACAINAELRLGLDRVTIAALARRAENEFVGVPTGSMDQLASMLCEEAHALFLDCRTMQTCAVPFEPGRHDLTLLVIDTHAQHELAGSEYGDRRTSCEVAASSLGLSSLRDATLDSVTSLSDPVLLRRARHVVTEIHRVADVVQRLEAGRIAEIGGLLTASHQSLRDDFEVSCEELDLAVSAALVAGALGARMTGGGFGGCAIALCRSADVGAVEDSVRAAYSEQSWREPTIWAASPARGAAAVEPDAG